MSDHQTEVSDADTKRPYEPPALRALGTVPAMTAAGVSSPTEVDAAYNQPIS
jgi:hypothetical protein